MLKNYYILIALVIIAFVAPSVNAVQPSSITGIGQAGYCKPSLIVGNIGGLINAGEINVCVSWQHEWTSTDTTHEVKVVGSATSPAGTALTFTWSQNTVNGCTMPGGGTTTTTVSAAGAMSERQIEVFRTTAPRCSFYMTLVITGGTIPVTIASYVLPIHIVVPVQEQFNHFCGTATNYGGQCSTNPTVNVAQSGAWTITDDANGWSVVNSGGQSIVITDWPDVVAFLEAELTGDLNVSLSGEIDVHQDEACGATIPCLTNTTFNIENLSSNTTVMQPYTETEGFQKGLWTFILFIFLIVLAEHKKDMIYHLLALIVGIAAVVIVPEALGIPVYVIVALMIYQIMRAYRLSKTAKNSLDTNAQET